MNGKEMIEEMAEIIYGNRPNKDIWIEDATEIAKVLLSAGYRKPLEGSVVLSDVEYSNYLVLKNDYAQAKDQCEKLQADNKRQYKNIGKFKESVRKQTAKEILKGILLVESVDGWQENKQLVDFSNKIVDKIEELAKQFGVEVVEE